MPFLVPLTNRQRYKKVTGWVLKPKYSMRFGYSIVHDFMGRGDRLNTVEHCEQYGYIAAAEGTLPCLDPELGAAAAACNSNADCMAFSVYGKPPRCTVDYFRRPVPLHLPNNQVRHNGSSSWTDVPDPTHWESCKPGKECPDTYVLVEFGPLPYTNATSGSQMSCRRRFSLYGPHQQAGSADEQPWLTKQGELEGRDCVTFDGLECTRTEEDTIEGYTRTEVYTHTENVRSHFDGPFQKLFRHYKHVLTRQPICEDDRYKGGCKVYPISRAPRSKDKCILC
jgi:hypothetical protein